ncbi:hypothetical protein BD408DRAFT_339975 [Parasitella parasitica]|nr:hypothetical protein BD408DRAFT_339975 [Parasitella parasitica]
MDTLNEATEQIRQLESQNRLLKQQLDDKNKEIRELEKKNKSPVARGKSSAASPTEKSSDRMLAAQLQHAQNQVRLLKSTMEQFLRMGVFNDDLSNSTSPTTSIDAVVSELRCGRSRQRRHPASTTITNDPETDNPCATITDTTSPNTNPRKSLVPVDTKAKEPAKPNKSTPTAELDNQLLELSREKEILQAEYSKAPSSGGNALVRRRREELESRLDTIDSQMCRIKLKMRNRNIL